MCEQPNRTPCCVGLLAHVDAGKTTLSEALLYRSGARRSLGRVDHGDAYLDTHSLERARGITIFSKQALLSTDSLDITLVDTPGHVDFSGEAERTLPVLDCAVLVISGTDGVQAHTLTLWRLLESYQVPVFLFVNKMDLPGCEPGALLAQLQSQLSPGCVDFSAGADALQEAAAMCSDQALEEYLATGALSGATIQDMIRSRQIFPCLFGSALRLTGVDALLSALDAYLPRPQRQEAFCGRVCKISRDPQGNRLTWIKLDGGTLRVRAPLCYVNQKKEPVEEKLLQLRLYSGEKFIALEEARAGQLIAATGLSATYAGQGLGAAPAGEMPKVEPVMTYRVKLPAGTDPAAVLPRLRQLEEEEPLLRIVWENGQIQVRIMGQVQLEVFRSLVKERFDLDVTLDSGRILYKETIRNTVEGVGHYEPLRHYAEVHVRLEPLPQGAGLEFDTVCPQDVLDANYQHLILTHMGEKTHLGVLTGGPVTDMKITLLVGRAHLKHTEGGDFRQATYRAIRQGLMEAESVLLEPWYRFALTLPTEQIGRAITDIRAMSGEFQPPEASGNLSTLRGSVPAAELGDYAAQVAAYSQGRGRLQLTPDGYRPCHNAQAVIDAIGYAPEADLENSPDSIFCAHGAGFPVKWNRVKDYMHLGSALRPDTPPQLLTRNLQPEDKALEAIMEREFGPRKQRLYRPPETAPVSETVTIQPPKPNYLIVDGYNVLFAWERTAETAKTDLAAARRQLCDALSSFAAFRKWEVVLVFDGYRVPGNPGEKRAVHNIQVVYTREDETGDRYIEALAARIGGNYQVRVATSDSLVQLSSLRAGVLRMSARELLEEMAQAEKEMRRHFRKG
ncbi:MAG: NYN domain-containing protein [Firmicutes bacterium]|nr:NYN domain-containing protein [Bacillota bacterium]